MSGWLASDAVKLKSALICAGLLSVIMILYWLDTGVDIATTLLLPVCLLSGGIFMLTVGVPVMRGKPVILGMLGVELSRPIAFVYGLAHAAIGALAIVVGVAMVVFTLVAVSVLSG